MLMREIVHRKFLRRNFMHGRTGISHRPYFISVKLLPPVKRSGNIYIDHNHSPILRMSRSTGCKSHHQIVVCFTKLPGTIKCVGAIFLICTVLTSDTIVPTFADSTIRFLPTVHRIPHSTDSVLPTHNLYVFNFNHWLLSPFAFSPSLKASDSLHRRRQFLTDQLV